MFEIGFSEILLITIVALMAIGPKDMPIVLFKVGRFARQVRIFLNGLRNQYAEVMHDVELDHYRQEFTKAQQQLQNEVKTIQNDVGQIHDQ